MASKRRVRRRSCEGKQRHLDRAGAERHAYHLRQQLGIKTYRAYRCKFCAAWHVGRRQG